MDEFKQHQTMKMIHFIKNRQHDTVLQSAIKTLKKKKS